MAGIAKNNEIQSIFWKIADVLDWIILSTLLIISSVTAYIYYFVIDMDSYALFYLYVVVFFIFVALFKVKVKNITAVIIRIVINTVFLLIILFYGFISWFGYGISQTMVTIPNADKSYIAVIHNSGGATVNVNSSEVIVKHLLSKKVVLASVEIDPDVSWTDSKTLLIVAGGISEEKKEKWKEITIILKKKQVNFKK